MFFFFFIIILSSTISFFFFFNDTATTEIYTLSLHDALPISKIYEMVINNDPCYAYLLECNQIVDQKLVMAHVYAHCDFFKNNLAFSKTNRKMMDVMANHATRIRRYMDAHGVEMVENFIDACLSLENLIDPHSPFIVRERPKERQATEESRPQVRRMKSKA